MKKKIIQLIKQNEKLNYIKNFLGKKRKTIKREIYSKLF